MYEEIITAYEKETGVRLTPEVIAEQIEASSYGPEFYGLGDAEREEFLRRKAPEIIADLKMRNGADPSVGAGNAGIQPEPGNAKATEEAVPSPYDSLNAARKRAIDEILVATAAQRMLVTQKSTLDTVLIAKPCPSEWMQGVGKLMPKQSADELTKKLTTGWGQEISAWLATLGSKHDTVIPTNKQLKELGALWVQLHTKEDGKAPAVPEWANFDNDSAVSEILDMLKNAQPFDVLVATMKGDEAIFSKPWRWSTKGFEVTYPVFTEGQETMKTEPMSIQMLRNFLTSSTKGSTSVPEKGSKRMVASLYMPKPKNSDPTKGAIDKRDIRVRVRNNSAVNNVVTKCISTIVPGATKQMVVKSAKSFLVLTGWKNDGDPAETWKVQRQRINLSWDNAPVFELIAPYDSMPGMAGKTSQGTGIPKADRLAEMDKAMRALMAQVMTDSSYAQSEGLSGLALDLSTRAAQSTAQDAANFS